VKRCSRSRWNYRRGRKTQAATESRYVVLRSKLNAIGQPQEDRPEQQQQREREWEYVYFSRNGIFVDAFGHPARPIQDSPPAALPKNFISRRLTQTYATSEIFSPVDLTGEKPSACGAGYMCPPGS